MKDFKEIVTEEFYDESKSFRKAYDKLHDAMSAMGKVLRKEGKRDKHFNSTWQKLEDYFDTLG